jgi:CTP synthase
MTNKKKILFITGGTCSSVGKGVILASIGRLLEGFNFKIKIIKIDPYFNQDAGTMNPQEHGEVWVTKNGQETDTDGGTYFRFLSSGDDHNHVLLTAGNIFKNVFEKERSGSYAGETVRLNPHIINEIKNYIINDEVYDVILVEIGGTIGEMELYPFLMCIKDLQHDKGLQIMHINVSLSLQLIHNQETKLKPIENIFNMLPYGLTVDMIIIRTRNPLTDKEIHKIKQYSYVDNIISLEHTESIYEIPILLQEKNIHNMIIEHFKIEPRDKNIVLDYFYKKLKSKNDPDPIIKIINALIIFKLLLIILRSILVIYETL